MLMPQQRQTETKYIGDLVCRDGTFLVGEPVKALFKHLHLQMDIFILGLFRPMVPSGAELFVAEMKMNDGIARS